MGYTTEFSGGFAITPEPDEEIAEYVNLFAETRHMRRDVEIIKRDDPDWKSRCLDGDPGPEGLFYVPEVKPGKYIDSILAESVLDPNRPPVGAPGLWCQWIVENGQLVWDGGEKFYEYDRWLEFLSKRVFEPRGYTVEGEVRFRGEDFEDVGTLSIHDGVVDIDYLW